MTKIIRPRDLRVGDLVMEQGRYGEAVWLRVTSVRKWHTWDAPKHARYTVKYEGANGRDYHMRDWLRVKEDT